MNKWYSAKFLTNSVHIKQPVPRADHPSPKPPVPGREKKKPKRRRGPKASCKMAELQKAELTEVTELMELTNGSQPEWSWNRTHLMSQKTWLQLCMKRDTNGMEYFHWAAWMSVKVCPTCGPLPNCLTPSDRKPRKTLVSQMTAKKIVSSYILFITTQKR